MTPFYFLMNVDLNVCSASVNLQGSLIVVFSCREVNGSSFFLLFLFFKIYINNQANSCHVKTVLMSKLCNVGHVDFRCFVMKQLKEVLHARNELVKEFLSLSLSTPVHRGDYGEACLTQSRAPSHAHFICRMNVWLHIFSSFIY